MSTQANFALGLDAGGTQTRWALVDGAGLLLRTGTVASISALQLTDPAAQDATYQALTDLSGQLGCDTPVTALCAGVSGVGSSDEPAALALGKLMARALRLPQGQVRVTNDMEIAYRDVFEPAKGFLLYAGTGSIAAYFSAEGEFHRAGGRGGVLDDAGSGYWIAAQALRHIWRAEDLRPGAWQDSPMAVRVFEYVGGSDWPSSRRFVYSGNRGTMGELALAVAASAGDDRAALAILRSAGVELARLSAALSSRFGPLPVAIGGRVTQLHPVVVQSLRACMPPTQTLQVVSPQGHVAAARMALR